jgi:CRP/FNR family nitrogen fixation transcriptional regulator
MHGGRTAVVGKQIMLAITSVGSSSTSPVSLGQLPAPAVIGAARISVIDDGWAGSGHGDVPGLQDLPATILQFDRGAEIVAQGEAAHYWFHVLSGCVRTVRLLEDGRRHIGEFLLTDDVLGWETVDTHEFAAEAVTPVTVRRIHLRTIEARADRDCVFAQGLRRLIARQVRATRARLVMLGRKTAAERIASFLLEMHERLRLPGKIVIDLPMGRADMADHLGLTIETVSRGITELRRHGMIAVERSRFAVRDLNALGLAGSDQLH